MGAVALVGGLFGGSALAINNTGAFELDGNALTDSSPGNDDWDRVCYEVNFNAAKSVAGTTDAQAAAAATAKCTAAAPTTGATAVSWIDAQASPTIFTGGGSKDPQDVTSWLWKPKDTVPDKDTIRHGFAARYSLPSSANCPGRNADGTPNTDGSVSCEVVFFGMDRFANDGDAQLGFWFFQEEIGLTNTSSQGGLKFSGKHQEGDLLLISNFSNGGSTSTISAYFWDPSCAKAANNDPQAGQCAASNLRLQAKSTTANCASTGPTAPFCGIVNPTDGTTAPWPYTDKKGNSTYLQGEFYEGGVNLSALGIGDECFSSIAAESRASTSPTSVLKDFVLGSFAQCGATVTTVPSAGSGGEVSPGTAVTDVATVQGTGSGNPPTPTGNVTFFLCSFVAGSTDLCDGTTGKVGTQVGSPVALATSAPPPGEATATSAAVNTAANPLAPGRYCFRAEWPGDGNYLPPTPPGKFVHFGTGDQECFIVRQIPTTTVTTPSDSSGTALSSPVALGTVLFDKAVVTGTSVGGTPTGTVSFWICNPAQVQTNTNGDPVCETGGTALTGNPRALVADANSSPPSASVLSSPGVTANTAGTWCFRAVYTPSGTTYTGSSDSSTTECVTVGKDNTGTVTTPQAPAGTNITGPVAVNTVVFDKAVVTGTAAGGTPTGTVSFWICSPTQVTGTGLNAHCAADTGTQVGSAVTLAAIANSTPPEAQATSTPGVTANAVGTWCFRATYTPATDSNYNGSFDNSNGECFVVQDSTSITSVQDWLPNDTATVAASGGTALNGTLTFQLYETTDCTGTAVANQLYSYNLVNATSASDRTKSTSNSTYKVEATKSVSWKVVFTPEAGSGVTGSTHCETTSLTINNNNP